MSGRHREHVHHQPRSLQNEHPAMTRTRFLFALPLLCFLGIGAYLGIGLTLDPSKLPSMLEGEPVPAFDLEHLEGRDEIGFSSEHLNGDVSLVNVFGSWCVACRVEHPFLMKIKANDLVPIHGIDWREPDRMAGPAWLRRFGDPYTRAGDDPSSKAAIAFGVTGAPETFVVDRKGVIRYKIVGPLNEKIWADTLKPLIDYLRAEPSS